MVIKKKDLYKKKQKHYILNKLCKKIRTRPLLVEEALRQQEVLLPKHVSEDVVPE